MRNIFEYKNNFIDNSSIKSYLLYGEQNCIQEPEVSVIIPCFKRIDYLELSIKSAIDQDFKGCYEIVICDNTPLNEESSNIEIVKKFNNPRILYYRNEENLGMLGNWNRLIELARAPFVVFLHDDDILLPTALTDLVSIQRKFNADGVTAAHNDVDSTGAILRKDIQPSNKRKLFIFKHEIESRATLFDLFMGFKGGFGCGCLYRREALIKIGGFSPDFYPSADYALNSILAKDFKLYYTCKPTFLYRIAANESFTVYKKFPEVDLHFRTCMKAYIQLPNFLLNRLITALYRTQTIQFKIKWEGDDGTLKSQLRRDDLRLCRIFNLFRCLFNDMSIF